MSAALTCPRAYDLLQALSRVPAMEETLILMDRVAKGQDITEAEDNFIRGAHGLLPKGLHCGSCDARLAEGPGEPRELTCSRCGENVCTTCAAVYEADADMVGDPPRFVDCSSALCRGCVIAENGEALLAVVKKLLGRHTAESLRDAVSEAKTLVATCERRVR